MTREFTNKLLERLEEGLYDHDTVIMGFCKYLSENDVEDMMRINELFLEEDEEE